MLRPFAPPRLGSADRLLAARSVTVDPEQPLTPPALDYAMENGRVHLGTISRRDIADGLRALRLDEKPPSVEGLAGFDKFMKAMPPPDFSSDDKQDQSTKRPDRGRTRCV